MSEHEPRSLVGRESACGRSARPSRSRSRIRGRARWIPRARVLVGVAFLLASILGVLAGPDPVLAKDEKSRKKSAETEADVAGGDETWFTTSVASSEQGTMIVNYWSKGPRFRAETIVGGHRINSVVSGDRYYIYDAVGGVGVAIERSENAIAEDATRGRPFAREWREMVRNGAERIQDAAVAGVGLEYEVYQLTDQRGRKQLIVTADETRLPIRIENFIRSAGQSSVIEYSGWMRGITIADSFFEPPSNVEFEEYGYDQYVETIGKTRVGPAPVFYRDLLHGSR